MALFIVYTHSKQFEFGTNSKSVLLLYFNELEQKHRCIVLYIFVMPSTALSPMV